MEEEDQFETPSVSAFFRHRSPRFSKEEVKALLKIIEKHKRVVLNRSTSAAATCAKEAAWAKIAKIFNSQGFSHDRSADSLKTKWDNLKKEARKFSKNLMDVKYSDIDEVTNQMIVMICDTATTTNVDEEPLESDDELSETARDNQISNDVHCNGDEEKDLDGTLDRDEKRKLINRSLNFTPKECNLLLQCVRREKNIVLSNINTSSTNNIKNRAWMRITNSFNKLSPHKRSTKVLRTKFTNMKKMAKKVSLKVYLKDFRKKHEKLEDCSKPIDNIKLEPIFDHQSSVDADEVENTHETGLELNNHVSSSLDPLHTVLSSDFPIGSTNNDDNKEIVKLKTDLLHYKMETAKLQRKLIEDSLQAEAANREAKAIEASLRLRTARLEAVAAELKLPPTHPALTYTAEEQRAQLYIHQYHES